MADDIALKAAEAAGAQGKFWEMHDKLFEAQANWSGAANAIELFKGYAQGLGLDEAKFTADYNNGALEGKIRDQQAGGNALGVNATPTFYLQGKKVGAITSEQGFRQIINDALTALKSKTNSN